MTFISDGNRTWDLEREIELFRVRGGREFHQFKLESPAGFLFFEADWSTNKVPLLYRKINSNNANVNNILNWHVLLNDCFPGMGEEQTRELVRQAMTSYETGFGTNSLSGHTPHDVVCRFSGRLA